MEGQSVGPLPEGECGGEGEESMSEVSELTDISSSEDVLSGFSDDENASRVTHGTAGRVCFLRGCVGR